MKAAHWFMLFITPSHKAIKIKEGHVKGTGHEMLATQNPSYYPQKANVV